MIVTTGHDLPGGGGPAQEPPAGALRGLSAGADRADAWERVREAIDSADLGRVADAVAVLDGRERKDVAARLPDYLEVAAETWHGGDDPDTWWDTGSRLDALRLAGAGTLGGAAAVVTWLNRRDLQGWWPPDEPVDLFLRVLASRPDAWLADLATRLTLRARNGRNRNLPLALALFRRTATTPPRYDPLVVAWAAEPPTGDRHAESPSRTRAQGRAYALSRDPLLGHLLPRLFEAEGVGRQLRAERADRLDESGWLHGLRTLAAQGVVARAVLLDGCLGRFLRGGAATDLRFFARLHEVLAPTAGEVRARARDYVRLLPVAPGPVAELAASHLRRLPALEPAELAEALHGLLFRAERKLVSAGLSWLDQAAREARGHLDDLAPALALAFACDSYDVQGRAVRLTLKYTARFTPRGAEAIREAVGLLPPDLGEAVAAAFGGDVAPEAEPDEFTPPPLPAPPAAEPFPAPDLDPARFVDRLFDSFDWQSRERWLADFVRLAATDRPGLRDGLAGPMNGAFPSLHHQPQWLRVDDWLAAMAKEILTPGADPPAHRLPCPSHVSPPHLFLLRRLAEAHAALEAGTLPPYLLATPTSATGHLDPAELATRLEGYQRAGIEAMPADLQQALLRLPRATDPSATARCARLISPAGRTAARWMSEGGLPDPVVGVRWTTEGAQGSPADDMGSPAGSRGAVRLVPEVKAVPTGLAFIDELLGETPAYRADEHGGYLGWWPGILPSHREVVAAQLTPHLLYQWNRPGVYPAHLHALAAAGGPAGAAVALLLGYHLAQAHPDEGVGVLLRMAARGDLPAADLGDQLALLVTRTWLRPADVLNALDRAARRGAYQQVWTVLAGLLPVLLPGEGERATSAHTRVLALAADVARWSGARGSLPRVAELASRKGSTVALRHARRLHACLTAP
ncbi:DUF6493 family protein [Nonomuraea sp. NPDC046570]|uniref:DUF7824 domain-containing protein n=1 Tax=Nonomuraea sp. NPDC046570 TaxID=3155255 RepID=UPI0033DF0B0B